MTVAARATNLGLRFVLELAVLASVAAWGFRVSPELVVRLLAGIGGPLLMAMLWGLFGSPKARFGLREPFYAGFELLWFGIGVAALTATAGPWPGAVLGALCALNLALLWVWRQHGSGDRRGVGPG